MSNLNINDEAFSVKKALGFSLIRLGNILGGLLLGEITYFATNSLGLAAASISLAVAIKTAFDACTDLIMGAIVDRTHSKYGKARPYVLVGILMWVTIFACFAAPSNWFAALGPEKRNTALIIYLTVFMVLNSAVFGTMANLAYEVHIKRAIVKEENRLKTLTIIGVVYAIGSLGLQVILPAIINLFHGAQRGFIIMAAVTCIFGTAACILCFFFCPEYTEEELASFGGYDVETVKEKVPIGKFLKNVLKNKYLLMYTLINFLYMMILMSSFTVGQYYFQFIYGNLGAFSIVMASSAVAMPIYIFIPKLCKKWGTATVIAGSMVIAITGVLIRIIIPNSLVIQCIAYLLSNLPNVFIAAVGSQINYECMEYGRYTTEMISEGMYSSFISFSQKMATSLVNILIGLILTASGFDKLTQAVTENGFADWDELVALGDAGIAQYVAGGQETVTSALKGIAFTFNGIPLIFLAVCIITFFFFHLERDLKKLRLENGLNEDGSQRTESK